MIARARCGVAAVALLAVTASAQMDQGKPHPHIADIPDYSIRSGLGLQPVLPQSHLWSGASPLFNVADGVWNNGEGFQQQGGTGPYLPDVGGWRGLDEGNGVSLANVFQYGITAPVWQDHTNPRTGNMVRRFVGYLRDQQLPPGQQVDDAAFEVYANRDYNPAWETVIVINTPGSLDNDVEPWNPHAYVGGAFADGWGPPSKEGPNVIELAGAASEPYNVVWATIKARTFGRPAILQMQRNLQLVKVVRLMLEYPVLPHPSPPISPWHPGPSWPVLEDVPALISGGSFGGWTSQLAVMLYPNRFQGAFARSLGGSMQRTIGEQEFWTWQNALCGFPVGGTAFTSMDTLRWAGFLKQKGTQLGIDLDFVDVSLTRRFRSGLLYRPVYFQIGDEDVTATGSTWIPLLHQGRSYVEFGSATNPSGYAHADVFWSVMDKRNHENGWYTLPFPFASQRTLPHEDGIVAMLHQTYLAAQANPQVTTQFGVLPSGPNGVDETEDPYDHVHARGVWPGMGASGPLAANVLLDPSFAPAALPPSVQRPGKSHGHGTWLGHDDSLIATDDGDVFVGSAEGVVTRFRVDATTLQLDPLDMSPSLGHGAWAMGLGDVINNGAGVEELVVATYRHLYVLDPTNLGAGPLRQLALKFAYSRPRRLQVADLFAQHTGDEILFQTHMGHLVVYRDQNQQLIEVVNYPEGGIQDLLVHPGIVYTSPHGEATSPAITVLSHRGHIANITLDAQNLSNVDERAQLYAWTPLLTGYPVDLETFNYQGQRSIAALYTNTQTADHVIRTFDARTMSAFTIGGDADFDDLTPISTNAPKIDFEIAVEEDGQLHLYVALSQNWLHVVDQNGNQLGLKDLRSFAPAVNALDIAVADIVDNGSGIYGNEVILSTQAGQVVWLSLDELVSSGPEIYANIVNRFTTPHQMTHPALVATWGMEAAQNGLLEVVDQTGTRWSVDPSTNPALVWFRHELRPVAQIAGGTLDMGLQHGPIRDMKWFGGVNSVASGSGFWNYYDVQNPGTVVSGGLETKPWQPQAGDINHWLFTLTSTWAQPSHWILNYDGYLVFPRSGDALADDDAFWWGGQDAIKFANLLQGLRVDAASNPIGTWSTTGKTRPAEPGEILDLRTPWAESSGSDLCTLRVVKDPANGDQPVVIVGTPGGSVMVLRPDFGQGMGSLEEYAGWDFGHGGCALAVRRYPESQPTSVQVFFGPVLYHPDPTKHAQAGAGGPNESEKLVSAIQAFDWDGWTLTPATGGPWILEDGGALPSGDPGGYGLCGLCIGDIIQHPEYPGPELIATTLNGDLFIFEIDGNGINQLLYRTQVEGALGAFNSIVVADLDPGVPGNELYVAGSLGLRKFIYQAPAP